MIRVYNTASLTYSTYLIFAFFKQMGYPWWYLGNVLLLELHFYACVIRIKYRFLLVVYSFVFLMYRDISSHCLTEVIILEQRIFLFFGQIDFEETVFHNKYW